MSEQPSPYDLAATLRRLAAATTPGEWVLISHQETVAIATALEQGGIVTNGIAAALARGAAAKKALNEILALGSDLRLHRGRAGTRSLRDDPQVAVALDAYDALTETNPNKETS